MEKEILFTLAGREEVARRLGPGWLKCELGFLDNDSGAGISDREALDLLAAEDTTLIRAANEAEMALDKVLQCCRRGQDLLRHARQIDSAWSLLKTARENAHRGLPKDG